MKKISQLITLAALVVIVALIKRSHYPRRQGFRKPVPVVPSVWRTSFVEPTPSIDQDRDTKPGHHAPLARADLDEVDLGMSAEVRPAAVNQAV